MLITYALAIAKKTPKGVEPSTYFEAILCPNSSNSLISMQKEMESLHKNTTWELSELPKGRHALTTRVEDASQKTRLAICGCNQKERIDFNEVSSPVVRHISITMLLAFIALFDLELEQRGIKMTFLHVN